MIRLTVSVAFSVWRVEKTRWPVSAACSATDIVSGSRISPTRMTSGSSRSAARSATAKLVESWPISRWLTTQLISSCMNSIGSSIVMMWSFRLRLMKSTIAASVVDLPEPVMPVQRTSPRRCIESCSRTGGRPSSSNFGFFDGIDRSTARMLPSARKMLTRKRPTFRTAYPVSISLPSRSWLYERSGSIFRANTSMSSTATTHPARSEAEERGRRRARFEVEV